jgi:hypothetical protein
MPEEDRPLIPNPTLPASETGPRARAAIPRVAAAIAAAQLARAALALTVAPASPAPSVIDSRLGGAPYQEEDEIWPVCAECGRKMTFFGQINFDRLPAIGAPGHGIVEAFCCDTGCGAWDGHDAKDLWAFRRYASPVAGHGRAAALGPMIEAARLRADKIVTFPSWEDSETLCPDIRRLCIAETGLRGAPRALYQAACDALGGWREIGHQLGGWPQWLEGSGAAPCARCGAPMQLLWRIDSLGAKGLKFGDTGLIYLLVCPHDPGETLLRTQCC